MTPIMRLKCSLHMEWFTFGRKSDYYSIRGTTAARRIRVILQPRGTNQRVCQKNSGASSVCRGRAA